MAEKLDHRPHVAGSSDSTAEAFFAANCASWVPLGNALLHADDTETVTVRHADGRTQPLTLRDLRRLDGFTATEELALHLASGLVLDLGCGAACHSAALRRRGLHCIAVDRDLAALVSAKRSLELTEQGAARGAPQRMHPTTMLGSEAQRSVSRGHRGGTLQLVASREDALAARRFDTILLLMNGLGLCGTAKRAHEFLSHLRRLLRPHGQILVESCDLERTDSREEQRLVAQRRADGRHVGESRQQLSWGQFVGEPFSWLYLASTELARRATRCGLHSQVMYSDGEGGYLARLVPRLPA